MSEYKGWGNPAPYTENWTNVDPGPPPTAPAPPETVELPSEFDPTEPWRRDPETGAPIEPEPASKPEPEPLPNERPWTDRRRLCSICGEPSIVEKDDGSAAACYDHAKLGPNGEPVVPKPENPYVVRKAKRATIIDCHSTGPEAIGSIPLGERDRTEDKLPHEGKTKAVQKWADVAMWKAPEHTDPQKPRVTVSMVTPDPLGVMAMVNAQYTGRNLTSPSQVTDDERREAWHAATVSKLSETPLEWIQWSINFENVSRAFTHQLVRTRMATYAQESQRFAVKEGLASATKLPPSLAGTMSLEEWNEPGGLDMYRDPSPQQLWRNVWDEVLASVESGYEQLVANGMPAEDARGLLPTNMLTRVHMRVDMKTLIKLAGERLCTQAQFEWRAVFAELAKAIREYPGLPEHDSWQLDLIASSFRPVCYQVGHCPMQAKSDRHCSIRAQVDEFELHGVPSSEWEHGSETLHPIRPKQWLADPTAARVAPGADR